MSFCILGIRLKNSKSEIELNEQSKDYNILSLISNENNNQDINCVEDVHVDEMESLSSEDGEYEIYSKIELHMSISSSLYILNKQGCDIMKNVSKQKILSNKDNTEVQRIYNEMEHFVNHNRACNDLYTNLINVLDAILFEECGEFDNFYVKEDEYSLESLYYRQGSWVSEIEWENDQVFTFTKNNNFDEGECMYLLMYVIKYLNLLSKIENEYKNIKLKACIDKMRDKMRNMHYYVQHRLEGLIETDRVIMKRTI